MKILILAAGYGTRLYSLVKDTPKALLDINGRPLLDYTLMKLNSLEELQEIIVVTNQKFCHTFEEWAAQHRDFPAKIRIVNDGTTSPDDRLGSIGDIAFSLKEAGIVDDLLVVGGDNLFDFNIGEYLDFARGKSPSVSIGLYDVKRLEEARKFGVVALDGQKKLIAFDEKPQQPKSSLIAMCFYYLPRNTLSRINDYLAETKKGDAAGDYIRWLYQKQDVYGFVFSGKWYDIGSVETYKEAQRDFNI